MTNYRIGIGLARLPKLFSEFQLVQSFKGGESRCRVCFFISCLSHVDRYIIGASKGGDDLSISPLATIGYPESLKVSQTFSQVV